MNSGARLRELMDRGTVVAPFVFDGVQARLAEAAGFEAVYMTGFGTAASYGLPDMGLIGLGEMSANAARIAGAVGVPVIIATRFVALAQSVGCVIRGAG